MGTPDFSVPTLEALIDSEHEVIGVVTQPDKPKGRGNTLTPPPVKEVALKYEIPVYQPQKVRNDEFIEIVRSLAPDAIVVIAFGQILPKALLDIPPYGCINVHASILPKLRGAGPIQWSVINGDPVSGITTMKMDVGLDTGDMLLKEEVILAPDETGGSLFDKLSHLGGPVLLRTLSLLREGNITPVPQNHDEATYAPMLTKEMGNIDWQKDAIEIERLIRGLNPWPSAYTFLADKMLKIWKAKVVSSDSKEQPGTIIDVIKDQGIVVKCGKDALLITNLQLEGKKAMDTPAFLRGMSVEKGTMLKASRAI